MAKAEKKRIRRLFREGVFARDGHKCVVCGVTEPLDAHHIVPRHESIDGGYTVDNGITLCDRPSGCHYRAEVALKDDPVWGREALRCRINKNVR